MTYNLKVTMFKSAIDEALIAAALKNVDLGITFDPSTAVVFLTDTGVGGFRAEVILEAK